MNLLKRLRTAVLLLVPLFLIIQYGSPLLLFIVLQAFILASLLEFFGLARKKRLQPQVPLGLVIALIISLSFFFRASFPLDMALFTVFLLTSVFFVVSFRRLEQLPYYTQSITVTFFGAFYVSFPLNYLYLITLERGVFAFYFLCAVIFLGDTGAFFFGKLIGRHKMTPLASPHKTWEGSVGGIAFSVLGALAARQLLLKDIELWPALVAGVLVHAAAQVSDPLESLFKRAVGVKDSSNFLPGHGGFLDRIDSLLLAAPFFYYFIKFFWK
ncbi:MAG TPA: phosphatidate cytidylyltransferase [Candidatus Aminicenantes bacterium]|nr:phosphatidate cytidylyltransferase [Candidatus Aminicenantes bacterium]